MSSARPSKTGSANNSGGDPVARVMGYVIFAVVVIILTIGLWIVATGIMDPPAPRSMAEKQIDILEKIVVQKPKAPKAWSDYARALIVAKQYSKAETVLDRGAKKIGKKAPEILLERGRLAWARGDEKEAIKQLTACVKSTDDFRAKQMAELMSKGITPDDRVIKGDVMESASIMLGQLYATQKDWDKALKAFDRAVYERPSNVDSLVSRGNVYLRMGQKDKATADFKLALSMIPNYERAVEGLKKSEKGQ